MELKVTTLVSDGSGSTAQRHYYMAAAAPRRHPRGQETAPDMARVPQGHRLRARSVARV